MKHYYIVVYQSEINERIFRRIIYTSRSCIFWFNRATITLLSFTKISRAEAKRLGYKNSTSRVEE